MAADLIKQGKAVPAPIMQSYAPVIRMIDDIAKGKLSIQKAMSEAWRNERKVNVAQLRKNAPDIFNIILADPPWKHEQETGYKNAKTTRHYDVMPLEKIKSFLSDIEIKISDNSACFLWVPNPLLHFGLEVLESWGFKYKTNFVWIKKGMSGPGWYQANFHELLLMVVRGSFKPLIAERVKSFFTAQRREHSRKPVETYRLIEKMYPKASYIELFSRNERKGWNSYGNEIVFPAED